MRKIIVISGMTGVGKSNIAKLLANKLNGEIIISDSVQVNLLLFYLNSFLIIIDK